MRRTGVALLVVLAAGTVGCVGQDVTVGGGSGEQAVVLRLTSGGDRPAAVLVFGSIEQGGTPAPGTPGRYLSVPRGTVLRLEGDGASVSAFLGLPVPDRTPPALEVAQDLDLSGGSAVLDVPPGDYTLEVSATSNGRTAAFDFGLRIA